MEVNLSWTGASTANVEVFRNGASIGLVPNTGAYRDRFNSTGTSFTYVVCDEGGARCSNQATANL